jgi:hypothetical protein
LKSFVIPRGHKVKKLIVTASVVAVLALARGADAQPPGSPLLKELSAIADRQLKERAVAISAIRDQPAAEARKTEVRRRILSLLGGLTEYRGPLNARVTKTTRREGFVIEHVLFESLPDYYVTANLYRPDRAGRHPAVLIPFIPTCTTP